MISKYGSFNRQCTLLSDSLAEAIERVCNEKDIKKKKKKKKKENK